MEFLFWVLDYVFVRCLSVLFGEHSIQHRGFWNFEGQKNSVLKRQLFRPQCKWDKSRTCFGWRGPEDLISDHAFLTSTLQEEPWWYFWGMLVPWGIQFENHSTETQHHLNVRETRFYPSSALSSQTLSKSFNPRGPRFSISTVNLFDWLFSEILEFQFWHAKDSMTIDFRLQNFMTIQFWVTIIS